jgi:hypothetical protein
LRWVKGYDTITNKKPLSVEELQKIEGVEVVVTTDSKVYKDLIKKGYKPESNWFIDTCRGWNWDRKKIAQELELSFLGSGNNFIDQQYVEYQEKSNVVEPIRQEYIDRSMWIFKDPEPDKKYVISLDVSTGRGEDNSSINILEIGDGYIEQVAEYCAKIPPEVLGELAFLYGTKYNNAFMIVDVTGGYGATTVKTVLEMGYKNMYYSKIRQQDIKNELSNFLNGDDVPGILIGTNRGLILIELERVFRTNEIIVRSARFISELKNFVTVENSKRVADHRRSTHDDIIMGVAIAIYVLSTNIKSMKESEERTKKLLDCWLNVKNVDTKNVGIPRNVKGSGKDLDWLLPK